MDKNHLSVQRIAFIGFISLTLFIPPDVHSKPLNGKISKEGVNIRIDSTVFAKSIGILQEGEKVRIIGNRFGWYKIILPYRFTCYASLYYLKKINPNVAKVKATTLNLRLEPSLDSIIIGKVKKNTILHIISEQNGWAQIKGFPHLQGWVHKKFINLMPNKTKSIPLVLDSKENKITVAIDKGHNTDKKRIESYNYFAIEGTIHKLDQIENCPANYKLKNKFTTFFLKIPNTYNVSNFLNRKVIVKGERLYDGCSYIYTEKISLTK